MRFLTSLRKHTYRKDRTAMSAETEYLLCEDCTLYVANRDRSGVGENSPWWAEVNYRLLNTLVLKYVGGDVHPFEPYADMYPFATSPCDGCSSHLAGSRHIATQIG